MAFVATEPLLLDCKPPRNRPPVGTICAQQFESTLPLPLLNSINFGFSTEEKQTRKETSLFLASKHRIRTGHVPQENYPQKHFPTVQNPLLFFKQKK
ncbi:hypothetical protein TNCV_1591041 [Trichonephila clavipes]|nr:hypothetical protein TNCV_1591041 [Trichonephila clavipes]